MLSTVTTLSTRGLLRRHHVALTASTSSAASLGSRRVIVGKTNTQFTTITRNNFSTSSRSSPSTNNRNNGRRSIVGLSPRPKSTRYSNNKRNYNNNKHRNSIPNYMWILGLTPVVGTIGLYYQYLDTVPLTDRRRWLATSPEWEKQMGDREYMSLREQFRNNTLPRSHPASVTVERVGKRICSAADEFAKEYHLDNFDTKNTTFTVVRSEMANAFVLPGNHVFVMTGLFQFARDEDELAAVLGHEMAHNLARHVGEKASGSFVMSMLARLTLLWDPSGVTLTIFLPAANLLRDLPHSRTQEAEADRIGMHLAAKACYDPQAAQRVFARMKEGSNGKQPPEFLSTHPSHESRIKNMGDWLPETRKILTEGDGGIRCERIRQEMATARRIAAQRQHHQQPQAANFPAAF